MPSWFHICAERCTVFIVFFFNLTFLFAFQSLRFVLHCMSKILYFFIPNGTFGSWLPIKEISPWIYIQHLPFTKVDWMEVTSLYLQFQTSTENIDVGYKSNFIYNRRRVIYTYFFPFRALPWHPRGQTLEIP